MMSDDDANYSGLFEAIDNAVEYYEDRGMDTNRILDLLINYKDAYVAQLVEDAEDGSEVEEFLKTLFEDGEPQ